MFSIQPTPEHFQYDLPGISYFEVYSNGDVAMVLGDISSVLHKSVESVYGSYSRVKNGECALYLAAENSQKPSQYSDVVIYQVSDPEALADSYGIARPIEHRHNMHASYSEMDTGSGRYAFVDIEFCCGCTFGAHNKRMLKDYLKSQYGWELILNYVNPLSQSQKTIKVERNSLSKTALPF